jgi:hypothetical protein
MYKRVVSRLRKPPDWRALRNMIELYILFLFQLIGITTNWFGDHMPCRARYIAASGTRRFCVRGVRNCGISQLLGDCVFGIGTFEDMLSESYQRP